jgi:hypothetical protein
MATTLAMILQAAFLETIIVAPSPHFIAQICASGCARAMTMRSRASCSISEAVITL